MIPTRTFNIIADVIPMVILFSVTAILLRIVISSYTKDKIHIYKELKILVYVLYLFILFQLVTTTDFSSYSNNFVPFKEMMRYEISSALFWRNVVGNIVVFIPFGYLITDTIHMFANKKNLFISTAFSILMSTSIEFTQMFIGRSFDIDDIILNSIGGLIGFIVFLILKKIFKKDDAVSNYIKAVLFLIALSIVGYVVFLSM